MLQINLKMTKTYMRKLFCPNPALCNQFHANCLYFGGGYTVSFCIKTLVARTSNNEVIRVCDLYCCLTASVKLHILAAQVL